MTAHVVAVANQKGGVAKTTTALSVAAALGQADLAVLCIDLDPQACATFALGLDPDAQAPTIHDVLGGRVPLGDAVIAHDEVDVVPACLDLAGAEAALLSRTGREFVLRSALDAVRDTYDVIVIDCPPSLGVLTLNGLTAADRLIVPVAAEALSHRGVSQLLETVADVTHLTNRELEVAGLVVTLYDGRTTHARAILDDLPTRYELPVLGVPVRRSVRFAEAALAGQTILTHAPSVPGAAAYRLVAAELMGLDADPGWAERAGGR